MARRRLKYSRPAREFISEEVSHLVREKGYPVKRAVAAAISMARRRGLKVPARRNPDLLLVNPRGEGKLMGTAVYKIAYRHAADGRDYIHEFEFPENVQLYVLSPSRVLLFGRHKPIIDLFERE